MKTEKIIWFNWNDTFMLPGYENAEVVKVKAPHTQTNLVKWPDAETIVIDAETPFYARHKKLFPKLKRIVTQTSRTDHIKLKNEGIEINSIGGKYCAKTIAEKCVYYSNLLTKKTGQQIKTVGIIGFGTIGQQIALFYNTSTVLYFDIEKKDTSLAKYSSLQEIYDYADLIIFICPVTKKTRYAFTKKDQPKKKPFIFNLSGPEVAPLHVLNYHHAHKRISGFWIDFGPEYKSDTVIVTSHTAWKSQESTLWRYLDTKSLLEKLLDLKEKKEKPRGFHAI